MMGPGFSKDTYPMIGYMPQMQKKRQMMLIPPMMPRSKRPGRRQPLIPIAPPIIPPWMVRR